jgi:hypothetical protein
MELQYPKAQNEEKLIHEMMIRAGQLTLDKIAFLRKQCILNGVNNINGLPDIFDIDKDKRLRAICMTHATNITSMIQNMIVKTPNMTDDYATQLIARLFIFNDDTKDLGQPTQAIAESLIIKTVVDIVKCDNKSAVFFRPDIEGMFVNEHIVESENGLITLNEIVDEYRKFMKCKFPQLKPQFKWVLFMGIDEKIGDNGFSYPVEIEVPGNRRAVFNSLGWKGYKLKR